MAKSITLTGKNPHDLDKKQWDWRSDNPGAVIRKADHLERQRLVGMSIADQVKSCPLRLIGYQGGSNTTIEQGSDLSPASAGLFFAAGGPLAPGGGGNHWVSPGVGLAPGGVPPSPP